MCSGKVLSWKKYDFSWFVLENWILIEKFPVWHFSEFSPHGNDLAIPVCLLRKQQHSPLMPFFSKEIYFFINFWSVLELKNVTEVGMEKQARERHTKNTHWILMRKNNTKKSSRSKLWFFYNIFFIVLVFIWPAEWE